MRAMACRQSAKHSSQTPPSHPHLSSTAQFDSAPRDGTPDGNPHNRRPARLRHRTETPNSRRRRRKRAGETTSHRRQESAAFFSRLVVQLRTIREKERTLILVHREETSAHTSSNGRFGSGRDGGSPPRHKSVCARDGRPLPSLEFRKCTVWHSQVSHSRRGACFVGVPRPQDHRKAHHVVHLAGALKYLVYTKGSRICVHRVALP
ncbi:hypothetical protein EDB81DRAFT_60281 [Dactylonectria macrodidyma]|uniref:Uncharacterized protein n=1 Tax=Dactylonectria macrodidyma TaxID=307937 RepID=A0A9P9EMQ5_9HYPO|nr:hypothetical protein EDB81DRAFT_60281 [Dactylonectria macrodidyma]